MRLPDGDREHGSSGWGGQLYHDDPIPHWPEPEPPPEPEPERPPWWLRFLWWPLSPFRSRRH